MLSTAAIFALLVTVSGSAFAVFSSAATIENNRISTATVNLQLNRLDSGEIEKPLNVPNLIPGEFSKWARLEAYNTSNTDVKLFFYVKNVTPGIACNKTNVEVRTGYAGGDEKAFVVFSGKLSEVAGPAHRKEITGLAISPLLPANWTSVVWQRAQLDGSAGNEYQNKTCTWDEVFVIETPLAQAQPVPTGNAD